MQVSQRIILTNISTFSKNSLHSSPSRVIILVRTLPTLFYKLSKNMTSRRNSFVLRRTMPVTISLWQRNCRSFWPNKISNGTPKPTISLASHILCKGSRIVRLYCSLNGDKLAEFGYNLHIRRLFLFTCVNSR